MKRWFRTKEKEEEEIDDETFRQMCLPLAELFLRPGVVNPEGLRNVDEAFAEIKELCRNTDLKIECNKGCVTPDTGTVKITGNGSVIIGDVENFIKTAERGYMIDALAHIDGTVELNINFENLTIKR